MNNVGEVHMEVMKLNQESIDKMFEVEEKIEFEITHPKMKLEDLIWAIGMYVVSHGITKSNKISLDDVLKSLDILVGTITKQTIIEELIGHRSQTKLDKKGVRREFKPFSTIVSHTETYWKTVNHKKIQYTKTKDCSTRMIRHNMRDQYATTTHEGIYNNTNENVHKILLWTATTDAIGFEDINSNKCTHMGKSFGPIHVRRIIRDNSLNSFRQKFDMGKITDCDYYALDTDPQLKGTYNKLVRMRNNLIRNHEESDE